MTSDEIRLPSRGDFESCVGESLSVFADELDDQLSLTLDEVEEHGTRETAEREAELFSVFFLGPGEPVLPQSTYQFRNERLGEFFLFIVPLGPDDGRMRYQAVFN